MHNKTIAEISRDLAAGEHAKDKLHHAAAGNQRILQKDAAEEGAEEMVDHRG